jgi:ribosomal protein L11 methyltransferase
VLRLAIQVHSDQAEVVLAELLELAPAGVEELDVDAQTVEYAIYGERESLPSDDAIRAAAADALIAISTSEIEDDWADRWREFHKPLVLGTRLSVRPPWEPEQGTELDLVIDPGRAFGTGAHATTRLCLEALLELSGPGSLKPQTAGSEQAAGGASGPAPQVVDLGCGSGVLAIAAAKLGWGPILALDYDDLAVDATRANAKVNGVADAIDVRRFDLMDEPVPPAPLVLANLLAPLLTAWVQKMLPERIFRSEVIILSGVLATEADRVCSEFAGRNFCEESRLTLGEWAASVLRDTDTR